MGKRKQTWLEIEDDRDINTLDLSRSELMVALDQSLTKKQKNLRIHHMRQARKYADAIAQRKAAG